MSGNCPAAHVFTPHVLHWTTGDVIAGIQHSRDLSHGHKTYPSTAFTVNSHLAGRLCDQLHHRIRYCHRSAELLIHDDLQTEWRGKWKMNSTLKNLKGILEINTGGRGRLQQLGRRLCPGPLKRKENVGLKNLSQG